MESETVGALPALADPVQFGDLSAPNGQLKVETVQLDAQPTMFEQTTPVIE